MKSKFLFWAFATVICSQLSAQHSCRTFSTDSVDLQVCYFTTGQMSTELAHRKSSTMYSLKAYDTYGRTIYNKTYGKKNGTSQVNISYHPNGGLAIAHYTMQPENGGLPIDNTSYFKPDGIVEREVSVDIERIGGAEMKSAPIPPLDLPSRSPVIHADVDVPSQPTTDLYLINYTSETLTISAQWKDKATTPFTKEAEPSDTIKIGIYYPKPNAESPLEHYAIHINTKPRKGYEYRIKYIEGNRSDQRYVMVTLHRTGGKR